MMQTKVPRQLASLARKMGATDFRRTGKGSGPNWYVVLDVPALGCKASVRYRAATNEPERRGFIVYWPFPEPGGRWVERQERRSRLSEEQVLELLGFVSPPPDIAGEALLARAAGLAARHPGVSVTLEPDPDGGVVLLDLKAEPRGQGLGAAYLNDLCTLADQAGSMVSVALCPDAGETQGSRRAIDVFAQFGFQRVSPTQMLRLPTPETLPMPGGPR